MCLCRAGAQWSLGHLGPPASRDSSPCPRVPGRVSLNKKTLVIFLEYILHLLERTSDTVFSVQ